MSQSLALVELHSRSDQHVTADSGAAGIPPPSAHGSGAHASTPRLVDASTASQHLSKGRSNIVIAVLSLVLFLNSVTTGLITVGLPNIASDLDLAKGLLLWPQSVYGLTSGSCLLLAGAVADIVGSRLVNLMGTFFVGLFVIACGFPRTGLQLIVFRAIQGVAIALCLPTSMGILSTAIPKGTRRNIAFSCLGLSQAIGFGVGLVLSGLFVDTITWRAGFYMTGAFTLGLFAVGVWAIPSDQLSQRPMLKRFAEDIDWVGAGLASACLAIFSYVLAMVTSDVAFIRKPVNIALLSFSIALAPTFIYWVGRQERLGKPALIPNSIWKNSAFTAVCLMVFLSAAVMQTMELFVSLFFQNIQHLSAIQSSVRFLPSVVVGVILELSVGIFVHRIPVIYLLLVSTVLSAGAPLLMALINAKWPYWYDAFFAQVLSYFCVDVLFTVGFLIVSDVFPEHTQSLAGAVFSTVGSFGTSIGLTIMGVISDSVTQQSEYKDKTSPEALEEGYRATFWASFALMLVACSVAAMGLRKIGKVGVKRD